MEFRRRELRRTILDPRADFAAVESATELRWDPLTDQAARILPTPVPLVAPTDFDLSGFGAQSRDWCPFCVERVYDVTPKFPPAVVPQGRIEIGEALLFPNLLGYAEAISVCVYSPRRHELSLAAMTPELVRDNLAAQVEFVRAVTAASPPAEWASINANHMLPAGSSLFHPHTQGAVGPDPSNEQRRLAAVSADRFRDYLDAERADGRRYLGGERVLWLASFAPLGLAELRAFVPGASSPADLSGPLLEEFAAGLATAMTFYAELGYLSCNWALYGAPVAGYTLNLRMVARSNLAPLYRSDVTWLERLHGEVVTDVVPEVLAERAGGRFRR